MRYNLPKTDEELESILRIEAARVRAELLDELTSMLCEQRSSELMGEKQATQSHARNFDVYTEAVRRAEQGEVDLDDLSEMELELLSNAVHARGPVTTSTVSGVTPDGKIVQLRHKEVEAFNSLERRGIIVPMGEPCRREIDDPDFPRVVMDYCGRIVEVVNVVDLVREWHLKRQGV